MSFIKPLPSPQPPMDNNVSAHPSSASLAAVKENTKVTNIWGLLGVIVSTIVAPVAVKVYSDKQETAAAQVATKQAALEQKVEDLRELDRQAHEAIKSQVQENREHVDDRFDELKLMLKKR